MPPGSGLRLLAALLALGTGVGCPMSPCIPHEPGALFDTTLFGVGQPLELRVHPVTNQCEASREGAPETVTVEVRDPRNRRVPATAELQGKGGPAVVRFTPEMKGRHHLIVSFSPVGSIRQSALHVVEDHSQQAPVVELSTVVECRSVDRTTAGTWLCGSNALREPDQAPQPLGDYFAPTVVAGNVVWVTEPSRVLRYVDEGSGPLPPPVTAPFPVIGTPTAAAPHTRLATEDELLLLDDTHLHRYAYTEEAGLRFTGATLMPYPRLATFGDMPSLLIRAGERFLVVRIAEDATTRDFVTEACPYQVGAEGAPEAVSDEPCHQVPGLPVGYEEDVLWARAGSVPEQLTLHRYSAASGRLVLEGVLSMDALFQAQGPNLRPGFGSPLVFVPTSVDARYALPSWDAGARTLELALLPSQNGYQPPRVGGRYFHAERWNSIYGVKVYARPSTP
ncbi:hypothetical protein [Myxococcus hansupus]|nr:hypothetical protein [Myxococcus hansupus]